MFSLLEYALCIVFRRVFRICHPLSQLLRKSSTNYPCLTVDPNSMHEQNIEVEYPDNFLLLFDVQHFCLKLILKQLLIQKSKTGSRLQLKY